MDTNKSIIDRFFAKVRKGPNPDDCWMWTGGKTTAGYGTFYPQPRKQVYAHRFSYEIHHGPIPEGLYILHSCDTPPCINPAHISAGTQKQNMADMTNRNRRNDQVGERASRSKLTAAQVLEIRRRYAAGEGTMSLVREFGIAKQNIQGIVKRKYWRHI